jgi:hypothetical protein
MRLPKNATIFDVGDEEIKGEQGASMGAPTRTILKPDAPAASQP